ncbi:MAG: hypothetical protein PHS62_00710 [Patescibacteria group bacterium]|nr:hypothetical protein [Patescibacteria group bacterium]
MEVLTNFLTIRRRGLFALKHEQVPRLLKLKEIMHFARILAKMLAEQGVLGRKFGSSVLPAREEDSSGLLIAQVLLGLPNMRRVVAQQLVRRLEEAGMFQPDYVAGFDHGVKLAEAVALILGAQFVRLEMVNGHFELKGRRMLQSGGKVLLVGDYCDRASFSELAQAAAVIKRAGGGVLPFYPVVFNNGVVLFGTLEIGGPFRVIELLKPRSEVKRLEQEIARLARRQATGS